MWEVQSGTLATFRHWGDENPSEARRSARNIWLVCSQDILNICEARYERTKLKTFERKNFLKVKKTNTIKVSVKSLGRVTSMVVLESVRLFEFSWCLRKQTKDKIHKVRNLYFENALARTNSQYWEWKMKCHWWSTDIKKKIRDYYEWFYDNKFNTQIEQSNWKIWGNIILNNLISVKGIESLIKNIKGSNNTNKFF